jgi:two-component system, chemotaxis family, response regulator Rcp1
MGMGKLRTYKAAEQTEGASDPLGTKPLKLLLVEDNAADVLLFQGALQELPLKVDIQVAQDAEKALVLLSDRSFEFELVILDLNLPKFSGYQVLERYNRKNVPVVVFTSSRSEVDARCALALGARDVVQKPGELRPYRDAVRKMIEKWMPKSSAGSA